MDLEVQELTPFGLFQAKDCLKTGFRWRLKNKHNILVHEISFFFTTFVLGDKIPCTQNRCITFQTDLKYSLLSINRQLSVALDGKFVRISY